MTCTKNNTTTTEANGAVRLPTTISNLHIRNLAKGYLDKSKDLFALEEALNFANKLKKEIIGEGQEEAENVTELPIEIDDELLIDQGLTVRTGVASGGGNNLLLYAALATAGIYLLSKN